MGIKNVQIPFTLFRLLVSYHLLDDYSCSDEICKGLEEKMYHLVNRQLYTQSKTAISFRLHHLILLFVRDLQVRATLLL